MLRTYLIILLLPIVLTASTKIESSLLQKYSQGVHQADVIITLTEKTSEILQKVADNSLATKVQKRTALYQELGAFTSISQAPLLSFLSTKLPKESIRSFWITNKIAISGATLNLLQEIDVNIENVLEIRESKKFLIPETSFAEDEKLHLISEEWDEETLNETEIAWGVKQIGALDAWEMGYKGQGIIVSTIDSGVRYNHEALVDNYREDYGWFDPYYGSELPNDYNGHGSHTMGSICGTHGIGVAPDSKWIACIGCTTITCAEDALLACGQWTLCPTLWDGTEPDCSKAPDISSNSWAGGQGDPIFNDVIDAWQVGGIVPVFGIGNSGPFCTTANSPGDQPNVISVGATTINDTVAIFSSHGPAAEDINRVKPEISAPGVNIRSASNLGVSAYAIKSGTSMSCPHVAGAIAVLLSKNPELTFGEIEEALYGYTLQPFIEETPCGNVTDFWPNNSFGWGRVDLYRSLSEGV